MKNPPPTVEKRDREQVAPVEPGSGKQPAAGRTSRRVRLALVVVCLWFVLINQLRIEWTVNPEYSYGWVVPLLALGLLLRRWSTRPPQSPTPPLPSGTKPLRRGHASRMASLISPRLFLGLFGACAFLILPCRLVLEANPDWCTPKWLLAGSVIALTLLLLQGFVGPTRLLHFAFPICFLLVAVPWPPGIETPLIQGLTRASVATTIELLSCLGVPALQHGNTIQIATGMVGVNEACSGIRSFHSSIMVALFLGEFFRLPIGRRLLLVTIGLFVAFGFNVCRTTGLTWLAAQRGIAAIGNYHDQAGLSILLACTATLWALGWLLHRQTGNGPARKIEGAERRPLAGSQSADAVPLSTSSPQPATFPSVGALSCALFLWLAIVELGVEGWYRAHETRSGKGPEWTLNWPPQAPGFREIAVPEVARQLLRYDEGRAGSWVSARGPGWQMYYFRWSPGRTAAFAARGHTPEVCLSAAGKALRPLPDSRCPIAVHSLVFPFRRYEFEENGQVVHVFHCLWEENAPGDDFAAATASMLRLRLEAVLKGRRNLGQRSLELVVVGAPDFPTAREAVQAQLQQLIQIVEKRSNANRPSI